MPENPPALIIHINFWTLLHEADPATEAGLRKQLELIKAAGFNSYCGRPEFPNVKALVKEYGLRFGALFDAQKEDQFAKLIADSLEIDDGPMNCQLANHDTPTDEAIRLTIALMEEADKQGARVYLEAHRDTCTETPEKTKAIRDGYHAAMGKYPPINYDFSHPAVIKHLVPENYIERLLDPETVAHFQQSQLWHMRPFNGQHCQIPITDGKGNFSPEYEDCRPFIREAIKHWLAGPRPGNELWVVPEQGCTVGYNLSCFPNIWNDAVALGKDIQTIWAEELAAV
jgi:protein-tyrosine phosphatase